MSDTITDIVRRSDPAAAHDGARKAVTVRSKHKRVALAIYYSTARAMSAQDVREAALNLGLINGLSSAESVRRRVCELVSDGLVAVVDERGPTGATYQLSAAGLPVARAAHDALVRGVIV